MCKPRPPLFKWRHFEPSIITGAVGWHLRFSLSDRDVEELFTERGIPADYTTIWRWVPCYAPELNNRCRRELKPTNRSWRVDETYVRVKAKRVYSYRTVDFGGLRLIFCSASTVTRLPPSASSGKHCVLPATRAPR